jgi:hypothetical protein
MSWALNRSLQLVALLVLLVALPSAAQPMHPYSEPISLGDRVINIDDMLEAAFASTPWTLTQRTPTVYLGDLSHRGYDVQARITVVDNTLTMTLDSITETGCGNNCKEIDPRKALGWLLTLRRNITYELTARVRDSLR